jgi:hypothetical protein
METIKEKLTAQKAFFENFYKDVNDGFLELRPFKNSKPNQSIFLPILELPNRLQGELDKLVTHCDVYFGVASRRTNRNGKKENCSLLPAFYIDVDYGTVGHKKGSFFATKESSLQHLHSLNLNPSVIIESGHGLHVYWLLSEPLLLNQDSISKAESIMRTLQFISGGDSTQDVSRILRVPYTNNFKTSPESLAEIVYADYECRCSLIQIENMLQERGFDKIAKSLSKSDELRRWVFSVTDTPIDDRSRFDQKIITKLAADGCTEDEICAVFNYFPTSGKYMERKQSDGSSADQYLKHSIKNAHEYIVDQNIIGTKEKSWSNYINMDALKPRYSNLSAGFKTDSSVAHTNEDKLFEDGIMDYEITDPNGENYKYFGQGNDCGYYSRQKSNSGEVYYRRLTNFIIEFDKHISSINDNEPVTYLCGKIIVVNEEPVRFDYMSASLLASTQRLNEYLHSLCGVKISIEGSLRQISEAIKLHNHDVKKETAVDFGYNESFTQYQTEDLIVTADDILEVQTPILYSNEWKKNKVGFRNECDYSLDDLKAIIIDRLFLWDEYKVTLPGFAFTMLSVIYPFLKSHVHGKPYLLLTGDSGSGKTTLSRFYQNFFGDFYTLYSATSTSTAMSIAGHSMKDVLFCIDDMKLTALNTDYKRNSFMSTLQNYSDESSRNRANVNLKMRDEKEFRGLVMLNGEDMVMTEASTIARGIVIHLGKKEPKMSEARFLSEVSKQFSFYTLHFIQHLLKMKNDLDYKMILEKNVNLIRGLSIELFLDGENLPRIINNLAILKTAWDVSSAFLLTVVESSKRSELDNIFIENIKEILVDNFNRTHNLKADEKFEELLFSLVDNGTLIINDADALGCSSGSNSIGFYKKCDDGKIKLGINLRVAYKYVNDYLRSEGGLGIGFESLKDRLIQNGKIKTNDTGTVTLGSRQIRGVYWVGDFPSSVLGFAIPQAYQIEEVEPIENDLHIQSLDEENFLF